jgi:GntR family transcriptional regulator, transcriptional repressor for pyruvate dehydrogenase complex
MDLSSNGKAITRDSLPRSLTRVTRSSVSASVFEQILSCVVRGEWQEGHRLPPERELCQQLGVARPSLREALKALEIIGLVESRVGDGTFVRQRSEFMSRPLLWAIAGSGTTNVNDIVESRMVLEVELAGFAALRSTADDLRDIEAGIQDLSLAGPDHGELLEADLRFHLAIAIAAHNQVLLNAVQMIRNLIRQWMLVTLAVPGVLPRVVDQHTAIFSAIASGDPSAARERMREHLDEMGGLLVRVKAAAR